MMLFTFVLIGIHSLLLGNVLLNWASFVFRGRTEAGPTLPSVSVLVPARNEEHNLPRLLESFSRQDHPDAEMIIYDDQSTDKTWEVIQSAKHKRIRGIRGGELPDGWVGKTNGCYHLSLQARGDVFLFIDADTEFQHPAALRRMCERFAARPPSTVLTGMTLLKGRGRSIVTMIGAMILSCVPWWLGKKVPLAAISGVNGQCWMISESDYRTHEPHQVVRGLVLEDIHIGRYLHGQGLIPLLDNVTTDLTVYMYGGFAEAWGGFRKNAADILGPTTAISLLMLAAYILVFLVGPILFPPLFVSMVALKFISDRITRQPFHLTLLAPFSYLILIGLGIDSIWHRFRGRIEWKGRIIAPN